MDDLKELSKKIKENTSLKKDKKASDSEIKSLFDNIFGSNSIGYLNPFVRQKEEKIEKAEKEGTEEKEENEEKEEDDAKEEEKKKEAKKNKNEENEFWEEDKKEKHIDKSKEITIEEMNEEKKEKEKEKEKKKEEKSDRRESLSLLRLHVEGELKKKKDKLIKEKEKGLETEITEHEGNFHIDIRKTLRNKKNVEIKDINKLIDTFNDEIVKRKKQMENFINTNKNKNEYKDKFFMLEDVTKELKNLEHNIPISDNVYELYLLKKKKKKNYYGFVFLKKFFNCLNNIIYFLEEAENCYKKTKLLESLEHLKNCKIHITLIKCLFKYVKQVFPKNDMRNRLLEEEAGWKSSSSYEKNKKQHYEKTLGIRNGNDMDLKEEQHITMKENNKRTVVNGVPFFGDDTLSREKDSNVKFLEDLKRMFYAELKAEKVNEKFLFLKNIKIKYCNLLNNVNKAVEIIFDKIFLFDTGIKINKCVYLKKKELIPCEGEGEDEGEDVTAISYDVFWNLVFLLKENNKYVQKVKTFIFFHFFKIMMLFYCFVVGKDGRKILKRVSKLSDMQNINCLTYRFVKRVVEDIMNQHKFDPHITHSVRRVKENDYMFSLPLENKTKDIHTEQQKTPYSFCFRLTDYIIEEKDSVVLNTDLFYKHVCSFLYKDEEIGKADNCNDGCNDINHDIFYDFSRCLFNFYSFIEISFFSNSEEKPYFDFRLEKNIYTDELTEAFSFYFESKEEFKENAVFFCKNENKYKKKSELTNILEKIEEKYQSVSKMDSRKKKDISQSPKKEVITYYKIKELSNSIFNFLHKMNLKRNNLQNVETIYFIYVWKNEEEKFFQLIKYVMEKNFFFYLNYTYKILNLAFHYYNSKDYIIINAEVDEYIYNSFLEKKNSDINSKPEKTVEEIICYIEKQQSFFKKKIKEKIESNISEKNYLEKHVLRKNVNKVNIKNTDKGIKQDHTLSFCTDEDYTKEKQDGSYFHYTNDHTTEKEEEKKEKTEKKEKKEKEKKEEKEGQKCYGTKKNMDLRSDEHGMNVIVKHNNISSIQIHKNVLYVVFVIYKILACSYKILLEVIKSREEEEKEEENEEEKEEENRKKEKVEMFGSPLHNELLTKPKNHYCNDIKFVENKLTEGLENDLEINFPVEEKFSGKKKTTETVAETNMSKENEKNANIKNVLRLNSILLSYKIIKYIYNLFLSCSFCIFHFLNFSYSKRNKEEHLISIINDNIFLKKVLENINHFYLCRRNLFFVPIKEEDLLINDIDLYNNFQILCSEIIVEKEPGENLYSGLYDNEYDSNSESITYEMVTPPIQKKKNNKDTDIKRTVENKKTKPYLIDNISILKKTYLFIDKFYITLDLFTKYFTKMYKEQFAFLLKKENMLTEDFFLINISKILSIIFDFFQIQILTESIHKQIILRMIDYFFYLINKYIENFVFEKKNITENERFQLYETFIFIQNSLFFILKHYKEGKEKDKNELPYDENYFLKNFDEMFVNLANMKKNRILFMLLFCKIKYILNSKKSILDVVPNKDIEMYLINNPLVCDDENFDAIVNEFT